jgi:hypothetical protein
VPVTAKLSRRFYEQFGDELTNELVDWFNSVDASYHVSLREHNEALFARFEARLEQRIGEIIAPLAAQVAQLGEKMTQLEGRLVSEITSIRADQARFEARLLRWTVGLWTSTMLAFLAVLVAVLDSR